MKPMNATAWMFATVWFVLAAIQSYRSFGRCPVTSGWAVTFWSLHVAMLLAPLLVARLALRDDRAGGSRSFAPVPGFALLTYIPVAIAMRLLETCVAR
jgi:hypothetical protein